MNVAVIGATGMLGSMVLEFLSQQDLGIYATGRKYAPKPQYPNVEWRIVDVKDRSGVLYSLNWVLSECEWLINCVGVILPKIDESNNESVLNAIEVNSVWPRKLSRFIMGSRCKILQIETDCVFHGDHGQYTEIAPHDARDVYGQTKSLGEVSNPAFYHLRCSIVGPEQGNTSLLGWLLSQPRGASLNGYADHYWNGITTLHFAKLCYAIIKGHTPRNLQHVVPADTVSKAKLIQLMATAFDRRDLTITPTITGMQVDRTLSTFYPEENRQLWEAAG